MLISSRLALTIRGITPDSAGAEAELERGMSGEGSAGGFSPAKPELAVFEGHIKVDQIRGTPYSVSAR